MCETSREQAARHILAYLADYRNAEDTLHGIIEWWLLDQRIKHQTAQVKEAIAELVSSGLVLARTGRDAQVHYRVNQRRYKEILALLKQ